MKLKTSKINILGMIYTIVEDNAFANSKLINNYAYIECYEKKIIYRPVVKDIETYNKLDEHQKKILRHEIIHAFFHESGLTDYYRDEVLVDYLAIQFAKIGKAFEELGVEEKL